MTEIYDVIRNSLKNFSNILLIFWFVKENIAIYQVSARETLWKRGYKSLPICSVRAIMNGFGKKHVAEHFEGLKLNKLYLFLSKQSSVKLCLRIYIYCL